MKRHRVLLNWLFAMVASVAMLGATPSLAACATSECAPCTTSGPDCMHVMGQDCAPACAAINPRRSEYAAPIRHQTKVDIGNLTFVAALHLGPEPPPPRRVQF